MLLMPRLLRLVSPLMFEVAMDKVLVNPAYHTQREATIAAGACRRFSRAG
ncbi:hypothetical protein [Burkholderia diffusa]|nr:hypothetical protein [Burkholderia diffusa]